MMKFINRKAELDFLEKKNKLSKPELIILYGRRRIGKTELINNFLKNKKGIYILGRLESKKDTIKRVNQTLAEFFKDFSLIKKPLRNWDEIFDYVDKKTKRLIMVLDEFPFIVKRFPEIISILQDKWDNLLKQSKLFLILSGSSIGMMEKYALSYKSPLYGRRTGQWKLEKLELKYLKEFFPNYNINDLFLVYSVLDTIPGYLVLFSPDLDVWKNIKTKILSKGEFLYEEINILLREEFRDPSNYMSILRAISGGVTSFNEIYTSTGLDKSLLSKYLFILEKLDIIEKILPVTETYKSKLKAKGALYFLKDNFFDFWFRFVYLNKDDLERGKTDIVLKKIRDQIPDFLGKKFENFVREILPSFNIIKATKTGRWWYKDKEIDLVALNEKTKEILFGECKWQNKVNAEKLVKELAEKASYVGWYKGKRKESYTVFAKSFSKKIRKFNGKKVYCFDLKDMERLLKKPKKTKKC